ncbi:putative Endothelin-converting enzyme 1 [Naematelia encephala]|uniref:Putative Endothelin-converting enzyme 1 n=1 Tax=Naematelia encephala TaxID=71784 RepID=A0A1Y2ADL2_9TREE|nr:putative Endothelin-converting enzyme 1 [Naematelia encephala]
MAEPRPSTDEESAPLLNHDRRNERDQGFLHALAHPSRPLTNLEKTLGGGAIVLLLIMSTFIGLFAGAETSLKREKAKHGIDHGGEGGWSTATETKTEYSTSTTTISAVPTGKPSANVCLTAECVTLAANILNRINASVDPCDDFYEFASGGWFASNSIPADKGIYGTFEQVRDNNKAIVAKAIEAIPAKLSSVAASADESNLHKLKTVYDSCLDVDKLDEVGLKPLLGLADFILETIGPFDLIPAPEEDLIDESNEWRGTYTDDYEIPEHLAVDVTHPVGKRRVSPSHIDSPEQPMYLQAAENLVKSERTPKITKALSYLASRGKSLLPKPAMCVDALLDFAIEGDGAGPDPQVQALYLSQVYGGLPSKEYYEEKPILDLYHSVIKGILIDIASHTHASQTPRDLVDELEAFINDEVKAESKGWPWPWPGDDDGDKGGDKDKTPGGGGSKDLPLDERMDRLAAKVLHFERQLIRAGTDPERLSNPHYSYNFYKTARVNRAISFLDLPTFLSSFAPRSYPELITVTYPPYLAAASRIVDATPDYVLSAYFVTRLALGYASALGPKVGVHAELRRLQEALRGIKKGTEENREDVCLAVVDSTLGFIAGREYVKEAFSAEAKEDGENIIHSIVKAFNDRLPHIAWMDKTSSEAAQKKASAILPKVGYPTLPDTMNPASLAGWYARLEIEKGDHFGNVLRSTMVEEGRTWASLGKARDRRTFEKYMPPQIVNAYYSPPDGEIVFPAGILQPPFYSHSWPSYLKYGAFGAVAAHELTHAFDNVGSQYDDKGRLSEWWTNSTVDAFNERAQCIARLYSTYYVRDANGTKVYVNGNLTNGEDIADWGLAQAYSAWKNSLNATSSSPLVLPGLDFTEDQLFFLAFAHIWAGLIRPATAVSRVRTDPHSPNFWRATGTLRNFDAFTEAFQCKKGDKMHPPPSKERCELW